MAGALPRSAREGGVYLLAGTLSRSVSLLLLPLYSRFLDATEVGDVGLASLKGLTNLRKLSLSHTTVSDNGLAHLAGLVRP